MSLWEQLAVSEGVAEVMVAKEGWRSRPTPAWAGARLWIPHALHRKATAFGRTSHRRQHTPIVG